VAFPLKPSLPGRLSVLSPRKSMDDSLFDLYSGYYPLNVSLLAFSLPRDRGRMLF